jgi:hypothetical protein
MSATPPVPPPPPETLAPRPKITAPRAPARLALLARDHTWQALLALAALSNLALFAYLWLRFDALPDLIPLHFDSSGLADRIEAKSGIFGLPVIGLILWLLDTLLAIPLHRHERAGALLLMTGALVAQILLWLAVNSIVGGLW